MLNNLKILVTRPQESAENLCQKIKTAGGLPTVLPTIHFKPVPNPIAFSTAIQGLGSQDWAIFISPQAVRITLPHLQEWWQELPPNLQLATVGKGTAKLLQDAGYSVTCYPHQQGGSEALLALPPFQTCIGKNIAIIRGAGGREVIDKALMQRGANVLTIIAYERTMPEISAEAAWQQLEKNAIQVIIATSFEGIRNLKLMVGDRNWHKLKAIPLCVMSLRIKKLAKTLGFETIWVTADTNDEAFIALLTAKRGEICQKNPVN